MSDLSCRLGGLRGLQLPTPLFNVVPARGDPEQGWVTFDPAQLNQTGDTGMACRLAFPAMIPDKPAVAFPGQVGMLDFARARRNMVDNQLRTFDVTDRAVLAAMGEVPREHFMPENRAAFAYLDQNVSISETGGEPRWILQPMVLARLIQALDVESGAKVLDVATGYGYAASVFATLGANVVALESDRDLANAVNNRLTSGGERVQVVTGPLRDGCPDHAPFDVVLINGVVETGPESLLQQLREGGRLGCFERDGAASYAVLYVRAAGGFSSRRLFDASAPILPAFKAEPGFRF